MIQCEKVTKNFYMSKIQTYSIIQWRFSLLYFTKFSHFVLNSLSLSKKASVGAFR